MSQSQRSDKSILHLVSILQTICVSQHESLHKEIPAANCFLAEPYLQMFTSALPIYLPLHCHTGWSFKKISICSFLNGCRRIRNLLLRILPKKESLGMRKIPLKQVLNVPSKKCSICFSNGTHRPFQKLEKGTKNPSSRQEVKSSSRYGFLFFLETLGRTNPNKQTCNSQLFLVPSNRQPIVLQFLDPQSIPQRSLKYIMLTVQL